MQVHLICDKVFSFLWSKTEGNQTAAGEKALDGGKGSEEKWYLFF